MMEKVYIYQFMVYLIPLVLAGFQNDRVLLTDVQTLTLRHGKVTNSRRSAPVPELKCLGGSAGCSQFTPQVVQCYNRGSDGSDVQWECKTDMDNSYRFGQVEVTCEGYDFPEDRYVLRGSCGLEYNLDLTKEGYENQGKKSHQYYGNHDNQYQDHNNNYYSSNRKSKSGLGDLVMLAIVGLIVYGIYKTCIANGNQNTTPSSDGSTPGTHGYPGSQAPPPPGFRQEYMPGSGCGQSYDSGHTTNGMGGSGLGGGLGGSGIGGGGFWSGAATGGLLGYLFGGRNNNGYGYGNTGYGNTGYGNSWFGSGNRGYGNTGSSWFGSGNRGYGNTGSSWFGSGSSGSSGFSSGSTGTRTASGFGGTKRR